MIKYDKIKHYRLSSKSPLHKFGFNFFKDEIINLEDGIDNTTEVNFDKKYGLEIHFLDNTYLWYIIK